VSPAIPCCHCPAAGSADNSTMHSPMERKRIPAAPVI
jgi:hypothetical protein